MRLLLRPLIQLPIRLPLWIMLFRHPQYCQAVRQLLNIRTACTTTNLNTMHPFVVYDVAVASGYGRMTI